MIKYILQFCIVSALSILSCYSQNHILFNNGKSAYSIVIDPNSSECVHYAAEELKHWLNEISGGSSIKISENLNTKGKRIILGYNSLTAKVAKGKPDGQNDSFTYSSDGSDIYLWGDTDRGTLYSVYSLLEKEFGCRWYNSRISVIPKKNKWSFSKLYNREVPALRMRTLYYYDVIAHPDFAAKMRNNSCLFGSIPEKFGGSQNYQGCHTLPFYISVDEYYDKHPEYFSEIDGKRIKERTQICLTNPDVLKIVVGKVREEMRNHPEFLIYSVSQGDWDNPCQCEKCRALKEKFGNEDSGVIVWFVNQVADSIRDEFPDKFIGTLAYCYSSHAPKNINPRDNVVIRLCSMGICQQHDFEGCRHNRAFLKDLVGWGKIAPHLYIWDYSTMFTDYSIPLGNLPTFQDRIRHYKMNGAIGMMSQGSYQSYISAIEDLKAYVLSKLQWNPDCDVKAVIKDFTDGFFGTAAGPIIRDYLDYEYSVLSKDNELYGSLFYHEDASMYNDEFIRKGKEYFEKAKTAVKSSGENPEYLNRIEYAEIGLCLLETLRNPDLGRSDGSLDLIKRVTQREGITILREMGEHVKTEDYIKFLETYKK